MRRTALALFVCPAFAAATACGGGGAPAAEAAPTQVAAPADEAPIAPAAAPEQQPEPNGPAAAQPEPAPPAEPAPQPAAAAEPGSGPERPILGSDKGAQGPTEFPHWAHQRAAIKCASCHHAGSGGKSCGRGADCHQAAEVNAPSAKDAFHSACRPCHKRKGFPTGCDFCHAPKAS